MPTRGRDGAWSGPWGLLVLCGWLLLAGRARALEAPPEPEPAELEVIEEPVADEPLLGEEPEPSAEGGSEPPGDEGEPEPIDVDRVEAEIDEDAMLGLEEEEATVDGEIAEPIEPDSGEPFPTDEPEEIDLTDPLAPVDAALYDLGTREGVVLSGQRRTTDRLRGETLTAVLDGIDGGLLQYVLERVAEDGYQILLEPLAERSFMVIVLRSRPGQPRGVLLVGVEDLELEGTTRRGESLELLRKRLVLLAGGVLPLAFTEQLAAVGYRATFQAAAPGVIVVHVRPGRVIRRVRVRGQLPLSERDIRRVLSQEARPGALAPGQCRPPRQIRARPNQAVPTEIEGGRRDGVERSARARRSLVCEPGDLACDEWERGELDRLQRFMFDNGYLKGSVSLQLACGRNGQEVDLYVTLRKGPAYRVGEMKVTGNLTTQDQRWIRRVFRPKMSPVLPLPRRVTRKHIEQAKERVASEYAEPRTSPGSAARRELRLPYPGVRVDTNFDSIERSELPPGRKLPLEVDVQLGSAVNTEFLGNERVAENRLRSQLQLFQRREPPSAAAARREAAGLRRYYQSRGFMLATVEGELLEFGKGTVPPKLVFKIREGPRVTVRKADLVIEGNLPPLVADKLERSYRRNRKIEERSHFTDGHALEDLGQIITVLNDRGYLCARASMRVAFLEEGLDRAGQHAVLDPLTALDDAGSPCGSSRSSTRPGSRRCAATGTRAG